MNKNNKEYVVNVKCTEYNSWCRVAKTNANKSSRPLIGHRGGTAMLRNRLDWRARQLITITLRELTAQRSKPKILITELATR